MNIELLVREFLTRTFLYTPDGLKFDNDTSFLDAGILDSMAVMELVTWTDATFGIRTDVRDITAENFDSVNQLASYIRAKRAEVPGAQSALASNVAR